MEHREDLWRRLKNTGAANLVVLSANDLALAYLTEATVISRFPMRKMPCPTV